VVNTTHLIRKIKASALLTPDPIVIPIPYIDPKGDKQERLEGDTKMFLACDWFKSLQNSESTQCEFELMFGTEKLADFWSSQNMSHPKFAALRKIRDFERRCIPICIHGDAAEFQDRDSLMSVSVSGLLKEGCTLDTSLLLASFQ
jgi:hypothetical protein